MAIPSAFRIGLQFYDLDGDTSAARREVWAIMGPRIDAFIERYWQERVYKYSPRYTEVVRKRGDELIARIKHQTRCLFEEPFDEAWVERSKERVSFEISMDVDMRTRSSMARSFLDYFNAILSHEPRLSKRKAFCLSQTATNVLMHDAANAASLHYVAQFRSAKAHAARLVDAIQNFGKAMNRSRLALDTAVTAMREASAKLSEFASSASSHAATAAEAADSTAASAVTMAAASEQLSASIAHVHEQALDSAKTALDAVRNNRSSETIASLLVAVNKISSIAPMISDIAAQVSLLSLNVTSGAAGAGVAGQGFAAVASEVKSLSAQTAKATAVIDQQIAVVQEATRRSAQEICGAAKTLSTFVSKAESVATAVDRQASVTNHIAQRASSAAAHASAVSSALQAMEETIGRTQEAAQSAFRLSRDLPGSSGDLGEALDTLLSVAWAYGIDKLPDLAATPASRA